MPAERGTTIPRDRGRSHSQEDNQKSLPRAIRQGKMLKKNKKSLKNKKITQNGGTRSEENLEQGGGKKRGTQPRNKRAGEPFKKSPGKLNLLNEGLGSRRKVRERIVWQRRSRLQWGT